MPGGPPAPILHSLHLMQTTPKINTGGGWDGRAERDAQENGGLPPQRPDGPGGGARADRDDDMLFNLRLKK